MSIARYEFNKARYERTSPIRGRAVDVRPLNKRRRDWETARANPQPDGTTSYACRLYETDCVEYFANGDVIVRTGGHITSTTARFISEYSPFHATKCNNHVWLRAYTPNMQAIIVPSQGANANSGLLFKAAYDENSRASFYTTEVLPMFRKVIDRDKAKAAREPFKPFLRWAKTFLALSDGWLMHDTRAEVLRKVEANWAWYDPFIYESSRGNSWSSAMMQWVHQEEEYLRLLCNVMRPSYAVELRREVDKTATDPSSNFAPKTVDLKIEFSTLKRAVYDMIDRNLPVHKLVQVEPSPRPLRDIEPQ